MARNKKAKEYASLAAQSGATEGEGAATPASVAAEEPAGSQQQSHGQGGSEAASSLVLEEWVEGDLKLRQLAQRIEEDFLAFCDVARKALAEKWYERFGYVDASAYFEERIGCSYRTMRRRITVLDAIERLPEGEREAARKAMVEIGSHKAAALAPMLGEVPKEELDKAVEFARGATEDAVQSMVSERLGQPHRGLPASEHPGQRFLRFVVNMVPPEEHDRTEWVFLELMKLAGSTNAMSAFLVLVGLGEAELASIGVYREKNPPAPQQ